MATPQVLYASSGSWTGWTSKARGRQVKCDGRTADGAQVVVLPQPPVLCSSPNSSGASSATLVDEDSFELPKIEGIPDDRKLDDLNSDESEKVDLRLNQGSAHRIWRQDFVETTRLAYLHKKGWDTLSHATRHGGPTSNFNPNAAPFVPVATRAAAAQFRSPADPRLTRAGSAPFTSVFSLPRRFLANPLQLQPPWITAMRHGCVTNDVVSRRSDAEYIVSSQPWDPWAMAVLVAKFKDRVAEGYDPQCDRILATFVCDVHHCFRTQTGEAGAAEFRQQLQRCILTEFQTLWHPLSPGYIVNLKTYPHHPQAHVLLSNAIAVANFAANLFSRQVFPGELLHYFISLLIIELSTVEHIHALHAIVSHVDGPLYDSATAESLLAALRFRASTIADNSSVVGQQFAQDQVQAYVKDTCRIVRQWPKRVHSPALKAEPPKSMNPSIPISRSNVAWNMRM